MSINWGREAERILGTAESGIERAEQLGVDLDTFEAKVAEHGVEMCPGCGWWVETGEMDDDGYCADCQE